MLLSKSSRRLAIFAFYDADGIADDYVLYLLRAMRPFCEEQIAVINGSLTPESEQALRGCCTQLIFRPNQGFDITGYKETFLSLAQPERFDEILFYNQTVFGPVCPLDAMFRKMDAQDVDFWGLTRHRGAASASWNTKEPIPPHIQSYFFAVRSRMFLSDDFRTYWQQLPPIESYWDAVSKHEVKFSGHFEALGYRSSVYMDTSSLEDANDYPMMGTPTALLQNGCPFLKRKSFLCSTLEYANVPQGVASAQALAWVHTNSTYPLRLIYQNLLRTAAVADIARATTPYFDPAALPNGEGSTAVVLWFAGEALAPLLLQAAAGLRAGDKLFCVFATQQLCDAFRPQLPDNAVCTVCEENGLCALFGTLWPQVSACRWVFYLNNGLPGLLDAFSDASTLKHAIADLQPQKCAGLLAAQPEYGLVTSLPCTHQENLYAGHTAAQAAELLRPGFAASGLRFPPLSKDSGLTARGCLFFARTETIAKLHDFPFTPAMFEGMYPAAEFLLPLTAQAAGAMTAFAACNAHMQAELINRGTLLDTIVGLWASPKMSRSDQVLFRMRGVLDFFRERRYQMTLEQAFRAPLSFRQKLWITLQIWLKPETFARLHHGAAAPEAAPSDEEDWFA